LVLAAVAAHQQLAVQELEQLVETVVLVLRPQYLAHL
jgi:hypothetical protein